MTGRRSPSSAKSDHHLNAWHGSQNLCSALVAAVIQVNELVARKRNALAYFHGRLALGAQERMRV
jgi:hypothetical protein